MSWKEINQANERKVLAAIAAGNHAPREIVVVSGLGESSVYGAINRLAKAHKVKRVGAAQGRRIYLARDARDARTSRSMPSQVFTKLGHVVANALDTFGRPEGMPLNLYDALMTEYRAAQARVNAIETLISNYK